MNMNKIGIKKVNHLKKPTDTSIFQLVYNTVNKALSGILYVDILALQKTDQRAWKGPPKNQPGLNLKRRKIHEAKYGKNEKKVTWSSSALSSYVYITDMITHIFHVRNQHFMTYLPKKRDFTNIKCWVW